MGCRLDDHNPTDWTLDLRGPLVDTDVWRRRFGLLDLTDLVTVRGPLDPCVFMRTSLAASRHEASAFVNRCLVGVRLCAGSS